MVLWVDIRRSIDETLRDEDYKTNIFNGIRAEERIPDIKAVAKITQQITSAPTVSDVIKAGVIKETPSYYLFREVEHIEVGGSEIKKRTPIEKKRQMFATKDKTRDNFYLALGFSENLQNSSVAYTEQVDLEIGKQVTQKTMVIGGTSKGAGDNYHEDLAVIGNPPDTETDPSNTQIYPVYIYKYKRESEEFVGVLHVMEDDTDQPENKRVNEEFKKSYAKSNNIEQSFKGIRDYLRENYGTDYLFFVAPKFFESYSLVSERNEPVPGSERHTTIPKHIVYQDDSISLVVPFLRQLIEKYDMFDNHVMRVVSSRIEKVTYEHGLKNQNYSSTLGEYV
jgi:hypothetical protein